MQREKSVSRIVQLLRSRMGTSEYNPRAAVLCKRREIVPWFPGHPDPNNHTETILITALFGQ